MSKYKLATRSDNGLASHWLRKVCLFALVMMPLLVSSPLQAQATICYNRPITTLNFRSPTLVSGTALSPGAIYRFANVSSGVDARVRINAINGGALATIDRDSGLLSNFQPELAGGAPGTVDFTITLVVAGTTTPIALDFAASGIDIDGDSGNLREYAEFSNGFAGYVLDQNTNLDVNASGPSAAGRTRFEAITPATAPGIDPTATQNIVAVFYTNTSTFNYQIGSLGTGATTRLTSLDFNCPALTLPNFVTAVPQDFGDAPSVYGNPVHDIVSGVRLGAINTSEPARYNSANADGDPGDDSVTLLDLRRGLAVTATVQVSGASGRLQAWVDFNGNGSFNDVGEQVASNVSDNGTGDVNAAAGSIGIRITAPAAAPIGRTFARFRWSNTSGIGSTGIASSGEVEDYSIQILGIPNLTVTKTSAVYDPSNANLFAAPGNEVVYSVTVRNTGTGPTDGDSVFVVDVLPAQVEFYTGDFDGAGPVQGPVEFVSDRSTLSFDPATDVRYSSASTFPTGFAACTYSPTGAYDPAIRYICLNPKGRLAADELSPPSFTVRFRSRIR